MKSVVDISRIKESMVIEQWPIEKPIPYARNARKLSPHAVDKVAASLQEFGWQQPLVVDSAGVLIVGHTRLLAAKKLGYAHVPVLVAHWLTEAQVKAYRLMDNRSHDESAWDWDLLGPEFEELTALNFDLTLTGFDAPEFTPDVIGLTDEDEVPEVPIAPVTQPGDLWILGDHRLMCGDSTSIDAVERLIDGSPADIVFTDPPYNVNYEGYTEDKLTIKNDKMEPGVFKEFLRDVFASFWASIKPGASMYVCHSFWEQRSFQDSLESAGFDVRTQIIWAKNTFAWGFGRYKFQHEPIFYCHVKGQKDPWYGDKSQSTLWQEKKPAANRLHPTMKPVELIDRALANSSKHGDIVLDLFGGSGTTLIAAEKSGRHASLMEIDPKYCDVIVTRWQNFTGKEATLDGNGCTFAHAKEGRMLGAQDTIKDEICR